MDFSGKKIYIETYGCQQNEADSETVAGIAAKMGFSPAGTPEDADLVIINTCAVREHAELKALSNTGRLKHIKEINPGLKIGVCGCMVQQERRRDDLKNRYPYVDFVFGTNMFEKLESIIETVFISKGRVMKTESFDENPGTVCEGLPVKRKFSYKAYLPIMSGCNNFCTYCIVPYVRGRERSKDPQLVVSEANELVKNGCREITLLGQNVNSFGSDLGINNGFAGLLERINGIDGDFIIRFMTSHPKDVSDRLIDAMGRLEKCAPHFHLPLQSGSDRILALMNRKYDRKHFFEVAGKLKEKVPGISITSDIIVGFPGETEEDFLQTLDAMEKLRFDNVFSFVYSPRSGTPAAKMPDQISDEVKKERMTRLLDLQRKICLEINSEYVGKTVRALCEGKSKNDKSMLSARSMTGKLIHFEGDAEKLEGKFVDLTVERAMPIMLFAKLRENEK